MVLANAVPKLRRHREQWQQTMRRGELVASYAIVPHRQLPLDALAAARGRRLRRGGDRQVEARRIRLELRQ